jgi:hypothetical protein
MKSSTSATFRKQFAGLDPEVQRLARKQFRLWLDDHWHPSLHFKRVGPYWSARVDRDYRALGIENDGKIVWFYIGRHDGYERRI